MVMKKIWVLALFVLAASWLVVMGTSFAAEEEGTGAPKEEIIIKGEKKSARFAHAVHLDLDVTCGQCHHNSEHKALTDKDITAMEKSEQLQCVNCHNENFGDPELQTLKNVFHARCKECHKQGVNGKTGPTKCTDCHVK
jgi:hypothetical protein